MGLVYVTDQGAVLGIDGGHLVVKHSDGLKDLVPKKTVDGISIMGQSNMTIACTRYCLENSIPVSYFTQSGSYFGKLVPIDNTNITRLRKQIYLTDSDEFSLRISKKIVEAKIHNQSVVLNRYMEKSLRQDSRFSSQLKSAMRKAAKADSIEMLMGYEGTASKYYFDCLSEIVCDEFRFKGRSKRPAKDPFNAMLNLGYSIISKEMHGEIENRGLTAYAGFLHKDRAGHPALASDMIEEWRPVIVDSVVMSLIQGHEIHSSDFYYEGESCLLTKDGLKLFLSKLERKMHSESRYLAGVGRPISFRMALWHQAESMASAVDNEDDSLYEPIRIR